MTQTILGARSMKNFDPKEVNQPKQPTWMPESVLRFLRMSNGTEKPKNELPLCDAFELESRVLYSGSPMPVDAESLEQLEVPADIEIAESFAAEQLDASQQHLNDFVGEISESLLNEVDSTADQDSLTLQGTREIIFVDENIPQFNAFISELQGHYENRQDIQIVVLTAGDGVRQISQTLANQSNIHAVQIVSHGSDGQVKLGDTTLNADGLGAYAAEIASWSNALTSDADLLIYGCDLAATATGQEFLESLSELTGTDVAASTDATGHETLGGDWDLEFEIGQIESSIFVSNSVQANFMGILPIVDVVGNGDSSIWLSTRGAANADGGVFWDSSLAAQFGDPNFELGDGGTDGTFMLSGFDSPVGIRGLHLVESATIQVGDATLQQGDLLLAIDTNHNFGFAADRHDILVFRPDVVNDYSSGTYSMFLDEAIHSGSTASNVHGFSLIEKPTVIGGQTLAQGTLLVSRSGGSVHDNLYTVDVTTSSFGTSGVTNTGSASLFIDGGSLGFDGEQVQSIEVLEEAIQLGDETIAQGSILLSLDTTGNLDVGDNSESIQGEDIFVLTVTATENTGGSEADAHRLFNGSQVGLDTGGTSENINALTITNSLAFENSLTVDTTADYDDSDSRYGNTDSISSLLLDKGSDNLISLREAIEATNNTANYGGVADQILFDFDNSDAGHFYYQDDGTTGSLTVASTDGTDTDFDSDYLFGGGHSWFRIDLNSSLPGLEINDAVIIDGYSQAGSSKNTLAIGDDARLRVELTNTGTETNSGLTFDTGSTGSSLFGVTVNRFGRDGIHIVDGAENITVAGNFIGTDITGTLDLGNEDEGIQVYGNDALIGGASVSDRNIISGNGDRGITTFLSVQLTGLEIQNNYIGIDASGTIAITNETYGVQLNSTDGARLIDNVISGNTADGIHLRSGYEIDNSVIQGNVIGLNAAGTASLANGGYGINVLALDADNNLIGGVNSGQGNVISGNINGGINFGGTVKTQDDGDDPYQNNRILGNQIGTDITGANGIGNGGNGITLTRNSADNQIGGVGPGEGNIIAFNGASGVAIEDTGAEQGYGNSIRGNQIFSNGGIGIDLGADGVTENDYTTPVFDGDDGPNRVQNFPELTSAVLNGTTLSVTGQLRGRDGVNYIIDFYATSSPDPSGNGEGQRYLGSATSPADFAVTDGTGLVSFESTPIILTGVTLNAGEVVTGIATHSDGSSSEFSRNIAFSLPNTAPTLDANGAMQMTHVPKNSTDHAGDSITQIINSAGGTRYADADGDPLGIAVIGVDAANGHWQFSLDDGANWSDVLTPVTDTQSLLLGGSDRIRFIPDLDFVGDTPTFAFRAWDGTGGFSAGDSGINASIAGGNNPFSNDFETVTLSVLEPVVANSDAFSITENDTLNTPAGGVLDNDELYFPNIDSSATLDFSTGFLSGPNIWRDGTGQENFDLNLTDVSVTIDPVANQQGINQAYLFDGTDEAISSQAFSELVGDPTDDSATLEFWFRPSDDSGREVIFETGGTTASDIGMSLRLTNTELQFVAFNAIDSVELDSNIFSLLNPASGPIQFMQVSVVVDFVDADGDLSFDDLKYDLYVNGTLRDSGNLLNSSNWSQSASETFAIGTVDGTAAFSDSGINSRFQGEFASFRLYEAAMTAGQIQSNYLAVASGLQVVSHDAVSANGAAVSVNPDGSFSYDSGTAFDNLAAGETANDTFTYTVEDSLGNASSATATITVTGVNDAPELDNSSPFALDNIAENQVNSSGTAVAEIIGSVSGNAITDADDTSVEGIAISAHDDTNGTWQYSTNNGANWTNIASIAPPISNTSALLLDGAALIRFVPNTNYVGTAGNLTFQAWDQSDGLASGDTGIDASTAGGTSAFSVQTATATLDVDVEIDATNDSTSISENSAVSGFNVLENDTLIPLNTSLTPILNFDADLDSDGNTTWVDQQGNSNFDLTTNAGTIYSTTPTNPADAMESAFVFDNSGAAVTRSLQQYAGGDPTESSASFEVWFNPTDASGQEILLDIGNLIGTSLKLNDSQLEFHVDDFGDSATATADISGEISGNQFIHVVGVVDMSAATTIQLYVNGQLQDTDTNAAVTDWSGSFIDGVGVGRAQGTSIVLASPGSGGFEGEIQAFRVYNSAMDSDQVLSNYNAASLHIASSDSVSSQGVTVNVSSTGDVTYDPGSTFDYLGVGETATDTFTYTATNRLGLTDTATVMITITGTNDAPTVTGSLSQTNDEDDSTFSFDLLNGATDVEGDTLNVQNLTVDSGDDGGITVVGNSLSVDPNAYNNLAVGETEVIEYSYDIIDGNGGSTSQTATITIEGRNDDPIVPNNISDNTSDNISPYSLDLLSGVTDPDSSDTVQVTNLHRVSGDAQGITGTGNSLNIDPTAYQFLAVGETSTIVFGFDVDDGNGGVVSRTATITITGTNQGPTISSGVVANGEVSGTSFNVDLLDNASDIDVSDMLNVSNLMLVSGNDSGVTIGTNQLTVDPTVYTGILGGDSIDIVYNYDVVDGNGGSVTQTATITITNNNDAPTVSGPVTSSSSEDDVGFTLNLLSGASDSDGDSMDVANLSLTNGDDRGITQTSGGNGLIIDPSAYNHLAVGEFVIVEYSYDIEDGNGGSVAQTASVRIDGANDGPAVTGPVSITRTEDQTTTTVDLLVGSSDPDTSDSLNITNITLTGGDASGISFSGNSLVLDPSAYNDLADSQSMVVTYSYDIVDGNGGAVSQTATVTITGENDAPVTAAPLQSSTTEDSLAYSFDLLDGATDVDNGSTLSVTNLSISGDDRGITLVGNDLVIDPSAYNFLATSESVTIVYSYDVTDDQGATVSQTATVVVDGVNDASANSGPVVLSTNEDTSSLFVDLLAQTTDPDTTDTLTIQNLTLNSGDDRGITYLGNQVQLDPNAYNNLALGQSEVIQYSYEINDGNGSVITQTATLTITGLNDAPVANADSVAMVEDASVTTNVLVNDSDVDNGDTLTVTITPSGQPANGTAVVNSDNTITYTPDLDFVGNDSITYQVTDGNGGTDTAVLSISVSPENDPPFVANPIGTVTVDEDSVNTSINLRSVFDDVDHPTLTFSLVSNSNASLVNVGFSPSGGALILDYQPDQFGTATIVVQATDGSGQSVTDTFLLTVNPVNDAPEVIDPVGPYSVNEDASDTVIDLQTVFDDVDDTVLSWAFTNDNTSLVNVQISGDDLVLSYVPDASGTANITLEAIDAAGESVTHTIQVDVAPTNDAPSVTDKVYVTSPTDPIVGNLLVDSNDIDSSTLTVSAETLPANGTLTVNPDGTFVFVPEPGFVGEVTFNFVASDGAANSNSGTVTIDILAPIITNSTDVTGDGDGDGDGGDDDGDGEESSEPLGPVQQKADQAPNTEMEQLANENDSFTSLVGSKSTAKGNSFNSLASSTTLIVDQTYRYTQSSVVQVDTNLEAVSEAMQEFVSTNVYDSMIFASLDTLSEDLDHVVENVGVALVASIVSMSGLSIGLVSWILRSGALVTSLLAQMPAWKLIDPLTVLGYANGAEESSESVQDIIDGGKPVEPIGDPATLGSPE